MVIIRDVIEASSSTNTHKYDIFISFRGIDTRNTFTAYLHQALKEANYETFYDDEEIEFGKPLKEELVNGIKTSKSSVIVLSENYASSTWCLEELVLILEQLANSDHYVFPIFYHVKPSDIGKQLNSFADAMEKHKQRMEAETSAERKSEWAQNMVKWKKALQQVSKLKGKEPKDRLETEFIKEIVTNINEQLRAPLRSTLPQDLIGMDDSIKSITSWLNDDGSSHTADVLTIWGMGGIGKTSLARFVFDVHSTKFKPSSFIGDISRKCKDKYNGLLELQKILYDAISNKSAIQGHDVSAYTSAIGHALTHKKVFIVLDDVDSIEQLNALLGKKGLLHGSKIIITTRNETLTEKCALFELTVPPKHKKHLVEILGKDASLKLLCRHAFKYEDPKEGFEEVVDNILKYCGGVPLALQVLGRLLRNEKVSYWEGCIKKLKKESDRGVNKVLRMSYDSLPDEQDQELFKHIACFFVGEERDYSETILKACDMETQSGIKNLMDRCLLSIGLYNELKMHSLIQEMGRDVVREESRNQPGMRSRIWCHEESFEVLKRKKGTDNVLGLTLDMQMVMKEILQRPIELKTDAFSNMDSLMILQLDHVQISGTYKNFPEKLRWLRMHGFPLKSIPSKLPMKNLVVLDMSYSKIEYFDMSCSSLQRPEKRQKLTGSFLKAERLLGSLKILDLSFSEQLRGVGGFRELPSIESLFLRNCSSLIEVGDLIDHCDELVCIDLSNCKELIRMHPRTLAKLKKVENLVLDGCNIGELAMEVVPRDSKSLAIYLPSSLVTLSLANNNLSNESFPMDFSCLSMLTYLCLDGNPIVSMPNCVRSLPRLETLSLVKCEILSIEHPPRTLKVLLCWDNHKSLIQKIAFDPEMSPLRLWLPMYLLASSSIEIEGMIKIQPIAGVDETILCSLGWRNLEFINKRRVEAFFCGLRREGSQTQMYYEFGIFSTIYGGEVMPTWIRRRSKGASISFTIPSSPKKLRVRGLNFCYVLEANQIHGLSIHLPNIRISNKTKNLTWIYEQYVEEVNVGGKSLTFLSHWMFGENEMEDGDQLTISIKHQLKYDSRCNIRECGVSFVYDDDDDGKNKEEALGYYKSWNHIIGGDLSPFQLTTGEYNLANRDFSWFNIPDRVLGQCNPFIANGVYKEKEPRFKAFSQKNSNTHGRAIEDVSK